MTKISHHISEPLLLAYASGALAHPFSLVVATHVSMCDECRARLGAHQSAGGAVMESGDSAQLSGDLKSRVMAAIEDAPELAPAPKADGIYPGPLVEAFKGKNPKWRSLGMGNKQSIISAGPEGSVRLLRIAAGQAMPDHGHNGMEMTLVLQGAFADDTGRFGVGDVEIADSDLVHTPVAEAGEDCICLAASDASLRFHSFLPNVLQPLFRI